MDSISFRSSSVLARPSGRFIQQNGLPIVPEINPNRFNFGHSPPPNVQEKYERLPSYLDPMVSYEKQMHIYNTTLEFFAAINKLPIKIPQTLLPTLENGEKFIELYPPTAIPSFPHLQHVVAKFFVNELCLDRKKIKALVKEVFLSHILDGVRSEDELRRIRAAMSLELYILNFLPHKNIMKSRFNRCDYTLGRYQIVYTPHLTLRSMSKLLPYQPRMFPSMRIPRFILAEITEALHFLHEASICHNGIDRNSVYIAPDGSVRLGDFLDAESNSPLPLRYRNDVHALGFLLFGLINQNEYYMLANYELLSSQVTYTMKKVQADLNARNFHHMSEDELYFITYCLDERVKVRHLVDSYFLVQTQNASAELAQVIRGLNLHYMEDTLPPVETSWLDLNFPPRPSHPNIELFFMIPGFPGANRGATIGLSDSYGFLHALITLVNSNGVFTVHNRSLPYQASDLFAIMTTIDESVSKFMRATAANVQFDGSVTFHRKIQLQLGVDGLRVMKIDLKIPTLD